MVLKSLVGRGLPMLFGAWVLVGSVLWTSGGASSRPAILATTATLVVVGLGVWHWSSRGPRGSLSAPFRLVLDVVFAIVFGLGLVTVGYGIETVVSNRPLPEVLSTARLLPFELLLWMFLYGLLAAGGRSARLQRELEAARRAQAEASVAATEARLEALRGQLNPHFLFNTLHGLATLVRRDPDAAESAIERLGDLLRYALDGGSGGRVPIRDEVRFTRDYLTLAQMARGDRLQITLDVEDDALAGTIPPFALQTLVENAIRHGVDPHPEGGRVHVVVSRDGDELQFTVDDPGSPTPPGDGLGVGLENLRTRLAVLYGERGGVQLDAQPGGGTRATLTAPCS